MKQIIMENHIDYFFLVSKVPYKRLYKNAPLGLTENLSCRS